MPNFELRGLFAGWTADSQSIYEFDAYPAPFRIRRVNLFTGVRESLAPVQPASTAASGLWDMLTTPQGSIVYNYRRTRSSLYVITGIR